METDEISQVVETSADLPHESSRARNYWRKDDGEFHFSTAQSRIELLTMKNDEERRNINHPGHP